MTEARTVAAVIGDRSYPVRIGRGVLGDVGGTVRECCGDGQVVVICDENVAPLYLERARESLRTAGLAASEVVIPAGERQKSLARAEELYGVLYDRGVRRRDTLVALGGGVVGDLVGHVAATYQRGVRLIQAPTTLLAQVDASVGGKVAVDFRGGKNYVGTFYQPRAVVADLEALGTLAGPDLRSGAAEVAKYALLAGGEILTAVEDLARAGLRADAVRVELVAACVRYKIEVVARDEREETGARAVLNLGHTIGHAVEAATGFARYSHGEAVGLGLRAALRLSERLCGLGRGDVERAQALLDGLGAPARLEDAAPADILALIGRDKKAAEGGVGYVLLSELGTPVAGVHVPEEPEREVVEWLAAR